MKRLPPGMMLAGFGMSTAVSLLCLFAAGVTGFVPLSAALLFFASLMTWVPIREEHGMLFALLEFGLVSGLALLISRRSPYTYLYIFMFGSYGPLRYRLRRTMGDRALSVLIRLLIFNFKAACGVAFMQYVLNYDPHTLIPWAPVWAVIAALEGTFAAYIVLYRLFTYIFDSALRSRLLPRR